MPTVDREAGHHRKTSMQDYGPIIGPRDPWLVRRGFVKNPVLVKDLRIMARHIGKMPVMARIMFWALFILGFGLLLGWLAGYGGKLDKSFILFFRLGLQSEPYYFHLTAATCLLCGSFITAITPIAFGLTILWLPMTWMFYGCDLGEQSFGFLRSSSTAA